MSEYIGSGEVAATIAALDKLDRDKRELDRWIKCQERENLNREARDVDAVLDDIRALTHAVLIVNGYHAHRGQWRKRRD